MSENVNKMNQEKNSLTSVDSGVHSEAEMHSEAGTSQSVANMQSSAEMHSGTRLHSDAAGNQSVTNMHSSPEMHSGTNVHSSPEMHSETNMHSSPAPKFVLEARNLQKKFALDAGFFAKKDNFVYAVNDVSFGIEEGKTYGLVGESGCGKSTTARLLMGMYKADGGEILFDQGNESGNPSSQPSKSAIQNVTKLSKKQLRLYREKVKYVFQDPGRSLNPRMTIYDVLTSSYKYSKIFPGKQQALKECEELLAEVGLDPKDLLRRPSEFSGGQRQRISIARGLIMKPRVLICDEVVSALDVSIQAQILNLLQSIREKRKLSFLFIAHDLKVACYFCDKIGVMYRGVMVEEADAQNLYKEALHPYTKLLFETSQLLSSTADGSTAVKNSEIKMLTETLKGCPFAHRCTKATEKCKNELPPWKNAGNENESHKVRCWEV